LLPLPLLFLSVFPPLNADFSRSEKERGREGLLADADADELAEVDMTQTMYGDADYDSRLWGEWLPSSRWITV